MVLLRLGETYITHTGTHVSVLGLGTHESNTHTQSQFLMYKAAGGCHQAPCKARRLQSQASQH